MYFVSDLKVSTNIWLKPSSLVSCFYWISYISTVQPLDSEKCYYVCFLLSLFAHTNLESAGVNEADGWQTVWSLTQRQSSLFHKSLLDIFVQLSGFIALFLSRPSIYLVRCICKVLMLWHCLKNPCFMVKWKGKT